LLPICCRAKQNALEEEKRKKEIEEQEKFDALPDWKKSLIKKKEQEKAKQNALEEEKRKKEIEEQEKFDALPDWKKSLIKKKEQEK
jgi:hypothetical protein